MAKVKIYIDGKEIYAEENSILIEVARDNGFEIPSFCHDPRLKPFGACRQCLVEIEGARGLVQACGAKVQEGMIVWTNTEKIIGVRRLGLEFLLSEHNGDCVGPCQLACPAGVDIQGFVAHIANGEYQEAAKLIREKMPFPSSVGRVCPSFCEAECRRNIVDQPISICALKRFAGDYGQVDGKPYVPPVKPDTGKRVAVVGGGPAGLTAAYYLALEGHQVTIFEAAPDLGGMMRYGIPEYRLPKAILDQEIKVITDLCQNVFCNQALGRDFTISQLRRMGFDAVFVGIGAWAISTLRVPGEDLEGIYSGIEFLGDIALGKQVEIGEKVVVIGGGNVAMDAARTSVRLGAKEVSVVYRRSREQMPANPIEVTQALEEGVKFEMLTAPVGFVEADGKVKAVKCIKMQLGEPDASGRRRPIPIEGSEFEIETDMVISAIGQRVDRSSFVGSEEVALTDRGLIVADKTTLQTNIPWLFAAGDCVTGPKTVVEAVGAGRKAAVAINQYLSGQPVKGEKKYFNVTRGSWKELDPNDFADIEKADRVIMPEIEPSKRKNNFDEFELGFTPEMAQKEAARCLSCGCLDVFDCRLREYATELDVNAERLGYAEKRHVIFKDHPDIIRDPNKCVLCGNCVRFCQEVVGIGALGFVNRGSDTVVLPELKKPLTETKCNTCGMCVAVCPTGALNFAGALSKPGPWKTKQVNSVCNQCNIGCKLNLHVAGNQVVKITSPVKGNDVNDGYLCAKGTFLYKQPDNLERLQWPLVRKDGKLQAVDWSEGINAAAEILKTVRDAEGLDSVAVALSPKLTNEEIYYAAKVARMALGTNELYSTDFVSTGSIAAEIINKEAIPALSDIESSDLVLVFGSKISDNYPIVDYKIRKAVAMGTKLMVITPEKYSLSRHADYMLEVQPQYMIGFLEALIKHVLEYGLAAESAAFNADTKWIINQSWLKTEQITEFMQLYMQADSPVIVVDGQAVSEDELVLIGQLAAMTGKVGKGMMVLYPYGNLQYLMRTGVKTDAKDLAELTDKISNGLIKALLIINDGAELTADLLPEGIKKIVITPYLQPDLQADVILPGSTLFETNGSLLNCEGRLQYLKAGLLPPAGKENCTVLAELVKALELEMPVLNEAELQRQLYKTCIK